VIVLQIEQLIEEGGAALLKFCGGEGVDVVCQQCALVAKVFELLADRWWWW